MSTNTYATLLTCLRAASSDTARESARRRDDGADETIRKNAAILDRLARSNTWPPVQALLWFRVYLAESTDESYVMAWKTGDDGTHVYCMTLGLTERAVPRNRIARMTPACVEDDIERMAEYCRSGKSNPQRRWTFDKLSGTSPSGDYMDSGSLLRFAYVAAEHGMVTQATQFVTQAMSTSAQRELGAKVRREFVAALTAFGDGGPRTNLLAACVHIQESYPLDPFDLHIQPIVASLEADSCDPRPDFVDSTTPENLPVEDQVRYWTYHLRDLSGRARHVDGDPGIFCADRSKPTAADRLVALGPAAIPVLIRTIPNRTLTRTVGWQWGVLHRYSVRGGGATGADLERTVTCRILTRGDVAEECLARISGCRFGSSPLATAANPEAAAVRAEIAATWWAESRKKTQAQWLCNFLNLTPQMPDWYTALGVLQTIEGPRATGLPLNEKTQYCLRRNLRCMIRHASAREVFAAFRKGTSLQGYNLEPLLMYGDRSVYRALAERMIQLSGTNIQIAAEYGRNWAIPLVAAALWRRDSADSNQVMHATGPRRPSRDADLALQAFQDLTGRDFGHRKDAPDSQRLAAVEKARAWWSDGGHQTLASRIAEDHPLVLRAGDILLSDRELRALEAELRSEDVARRRRAVSSLDKVHSMELQHALLDALDAEEEFPDEQVRILSFLSQRPAVWHLRSVSAVFARGASVGARLQAGRVIESVMAAEAPSWYWLEPVESALAMARRIAAAPEEPPDLRKQAEAILSARRQAEREERMRQGIRELSGSYRQPTPAAIRP